MSGNTFTFDTLPEWHKKMFHLLLENQFPGKDKIREQLYNAVFEIIDGNGSLGINVQDNNLIAPGEKTIPVEAYGTDLDNSEIEVLLFKSKGLVYMLEILRLDGNSVLKLPQPEQFEFMVLGK